MKASTKWLLALTALPCAFGVATGVLRYQSHRMRMLFREDKHLASEHPSEFDRAFTLDALTPSSVAHETILPLGDTDEDLPALAILGDSWLAGINTPSPAHLASPAYLIGRGLSRVTASRVRVRAVAQPAAAADDIYDQVSAVLSDRRMRRSRTGTPTVRYAILSMGSADVIHPLVGSLSGPVFSRALNRLQREGGYTVIVLTCPNLGLLPGVRRPLRTLLRRSSRVMSGSQWVMAVSARAHPISLNQTLSGTTQVGLLSAAGRYPSPLGYRQIAARVLDTILTDLDANVTANVTPDVATDLTPENAEETPS